MFLKTLEHRKEEDGGCSSTHNQKYTLVQCISYKQHRSQLLLLSEIITSSSAAIAITAKIEPTTVVTSK
jgi:hypothetical protein